MTPLRFCLEPRCAVRVTRGRCAAHRSQAERRRGTPTDRGYGPDHRAARELLRASLPALCGYGCGTLLVPQGQWVAAHRVDGHPEYGYLASCYPCNERAKRSPGPVVRPGR